MSAQKIALFGGIVLPCHDSVVAATPEITPVFTPPDKTLLAGSQSFYSLHLWIKPADAEAVVAPFPPEPVGVPLQYNLTAHRGSSPNSKRRIWTSVTTEMVGVGTDVSGVPLQISASWGVPVKVLDGYIVRGDVQIELSSGPLEDGGEDLFQYPKGTKIWGYYQRLGAQNEAWNFIGEPPAGPLFDTGIPIEFAKGEQKIIHTFDPDRSDEIFLGLTSGIDVPVAGSSMFLSFVDANMVEVSKSTVEFLATRPVFGSMNFLRDPQSVYNFHGVFGGNPRVRYLVLTSSQAATTVHGRYVRH